MKILYVTTVAITFQFFTEHIKMLQEKDNVVELASNFKDPLPDQVERLGCKIHHVPFSRNPFSSRNVHAYQQLKELLRSGNYDIVHTHTPNASAVVRLAARKLRKKGLKVYYTAHGFHFYKGAPVKNWLIYYPVEWLCAHWTDKLITINTEDYALAQKHMHAKHVEYVPGVGVDLTRFQNVQADRTEKRRELGIPENAILLFSAGELNVNKNHQVVLRALAQLNNPKIHYAIAGVGDQKENLFNLAEELHIDRQVHLLGYRSDIPELLMCSDVYILPSIREGLNVSLMEAMASGLPCIAGDIRGNRDLIDSERGGMLFLPSNTESTVHALEYVFARLDKDMGKYNKTKIEKFGLVNLLEALKKVYGVQ